MTTRKLHEINLSLPVQKYFEEKGYEVYFEVPEIQRVVDIVAIKRTDSHVEIIAIELKMGYCKKALEQARTNTSFADKSYIAVKTKPRHKNVLKCQAMNIGVLLVSDTVRILSRATETKYGPLSGHQKSVLLSCDRNKDNAIAGMPCLSGVGPAVEVSRSIEEYVKRHPNASWKEIYANIPNHYASPASMRQSIEKFHHREYLKEKHKDKKCGECYRLTNKYSSCPKNANRKPISKACIDFIEPEENS